MAVKAEPTFSLKDQLFNKAKLQMIAGEISAIYPEFKSKKFIAAVTKKFPELELMERLYWIRDCLHDFLPKGYRNAVGVLVESLPPVLDVNNTDDDYGDFIYGPYGAFIAEYGCTKKDLQFSLQALKEMTKRFSVEFPIRSFINAYPEQTLSFLLKCASDKNYHVRRLASEGTRTKLPWAKNITISYNEPLPILDTLFSDETRYVTRSVANHMNDISKVDPDLVVDTLKRWQTSGKQSDTEMNFIIKHSLRTLEKQGHPAALQLLGCDGREVKVQKLQITTPTVVVGQSLEFSFTVVSTGAKPQKLVVDYRLYFQKASGEMTPKTFKIAKVVIQPGETLSFTKKQPLRPMTTRTLYPGKHEIELQINGITSSRKSFFLLTI